MRHVGRIRLIVVLFLLVFLHQSVPIVRTSGYAETGYEPFGRMAGLGVAGWDSCTLIRGQNKYSNYLKNYGLWGNFYSYEGRLRPKSSVFDKLKNTDTGMQFGIDLPGNGLFSTCLFYSYSSPMHSVLQSSDRFFDDSHLNAANHLFGLRWQSYGDGLFMLFGLNGGFDHYDFGTQNNGTFDGSGWQLGGNCEFGLDVELEKWQLRPHLTFDYRWLQHNDLDNSQGVLFDGHTYNALYSNLGLRAFRPLGPILEWQTRLSWLHNYLGSNAPVRVQRYGSISGLTSPTLLFLEGNIGRDWLWFGTGLKFHFGTFFSFFIDYDLTFNKYETTHCGSLMAILAW